jgi:hypothetical protein
MRREEERSNDMTQFPERISHAETGPGGWSTERIYHGSRANELVLSDERPMYLTFERAEAYGFVLLMQFLGGEHGDSEPSILEFKFRPGPTTDINDRIYKAMETGDFDESVIDQAIAETKRGAPHTRYLTFTHPGFVGEDFDALVALYPRSDLRGVTAYEQLVKKLASNSRFKQGKPGQAFQILGARRST